jgi:hypothetical protein
MRRPVSLLLFCLLLILSAASAAEDMRDHPVWSLHELMQEMATIETRSNRFEEVKEMAILDQAITQTGTLHFKAPDKLSKQIPFPVASSFEIQGDQLTIMTAGKPDQQMDLEAYPPLRIFVESLRAVLAGDLDALQRHFATQLQGDRQGWRLSLHPRDRVLARQVERIDIEGHATDINRYGILETNGDRTLTTLTPLSD